MESKNELILCIILAYFVVSFFFLLLLILCLAFSSGFCPGFVMCNLCPFDFGHYH